MNITKQEAQESLAEIDRAVSQTKGAISHFGGYILMMWGVVWAIGFSITQFRPDISGWSWLVLDAIGFAGTWLFIRHSNLEFRRQGRSRIWLAWGILFAYMVLWGALLHPSGRAGIAFYVTVGMFGYVVMGLWFSRALLWTGLAVTGLTLAGFFLLPAWFSFWMGMTGGGALFAAGLSICKSWK